DVRNQCVRFILKPLLISEEEEDEHDKFNIAAQIRLPQKCPGVPVPGYRQTFARHQAPYTRRRLEHLVVRAARYSSTAQSQSRTSTPNRFATILSYPARRVPQTPEPPRVLRPFARCIHAGAQRPTSPPTRPLPRLSLPKRRRLTSPRLAR